MGSKVIPIKLMSSAVRYYSVSKGRFSKALIAFAIASLYFAPAQGSFKNAYELYQHKQFREAFYNFKNLAHIGSKASQYSLGVMYYRGEHVEREPVEAYAWVKLAAEGGNEKYSSTAEKIYGELGDKAQEVAQQRYQVLLGLYGKDIIDGLLAPEPLSDEDCEQPPERIGKLRAKYPREAFKGGKARVGFSDLLVNVSKKGYARDITLRQRTDEMFVEPSVKALIRARWNPKLENGRPVMYRDVYFRFVYAMNNGHVLSDKLEKSILAELEKAENNDVRAQYKYAKQLEAAKAYVELRDKLDLEYQTANEWYLKAAKRGHPLAQYELGKNMAAGRGCKTDADAGSKWVFASATSGHPFAQAEVAISLRENEPNETVQMLYWLRRAAEGNYYRAKVMLAWSLSTLADSKLRDPEEALRLLESEPTMYYDEVRILETKAAANAANGDYKAAVGLQKKAINRAKKLGWEIPVMELRLTSYQNGKNWTGAYHL